MSHAVGSIIQDQDYSYSNRGLTTNNSIAIVDKRISTKDADMVIDSLGDLISNAEYRPFFYARLYALGIGNFLGKAEQARKYGRNPAQYFVHLIK